MDVLFINGKRNGYGINQCGKTLTINELMEILNDYDKDTLIYLNNNHYTYGNITSDDIYLEQIEN